MTRGYTTFHSFQWDIPINAWQHLHRAAFAGQQIGTHIPFKPPTTQKHNPPIINHGNGKSQYFYCGCGREWDQPHDIHPRCCCAAHVNGVSLHRLAKVHEGSAPPVTDEIVHLAREYDGILMTNRYIFSHFFPRKRWIDHLFIDWLWKILAGNKSDFPLRYWVSCLFRSPNLEKIRKSWHHVLEWFFPIYGTSFAKSRSKPPTRF